MKNKEGGAGDMRGGRRDRRVGERGTDTQREGMREIEEVGIGAL